MKIEIIGKRNMKIEIIGKRKDYINELKPGDLFSFISPHGHKVYILLKPSYNTGDYYHYACIDSEFLIFRDLNNKEVNYIGSLKVEL